MTEPGTTPALPAQVPLAPLIEEYSGEFAKLLPAHIGQARYERWAVGLLRKSLDPGNTAQSAKAAAVWREVLAAPAGQLSVMQALMDCASLGLEPGREYHLVPRGGTVTGITDYKGEIRLITNAQRCVVVAQLVRVLDTFHMTGANIPPRHEADWFADRGPVTGGYAYADFGGSLYSQVVRMAEKSSSSGQDSFEHHRDQAQTRTIWDEWPEAMRLKTLIHQLRKIVPWSPDIRHD